MEFVKTLRALSLPKQIAVAGAVLGIVAIMTVMFQGATHKPMVLLYSGLDAARAGEVIEELEKRGIKYDVRGEALFIPEPVRDELRLALARDGLPRQAIQGYELLDGVNGFSVTSEMYNASYFRAKEGELTRTILSMPGVEAARVHIGANLKSGFARRQSEQTASVTVSTHRPLSKPQAESIQYLVALAIAGLNPASVVVIDSGDGIIAGPNAQSSAAFPTSSLPEQRQLEQKVLQMLEARVGIGNARVSATIDVAREIRRSSEVRYDPESRIVRSRKTQDKSESRQGGNGALTVASNLPQEAGGGQGGSTNEIQDSSEFIDYALNEVRTEIEQLPGRVERVTIAVLLNEGAFNFDPSTANYQQQLDRAIQNIRQLVTTAAGLDTERGDLISVEVMPFAVVEDAELIAKPTLLETMMERYLWSAIQVLILGVIITVLGFGVVRPIFSQQASRDLDDETRVSEDTADSVTMVADPNVSPFDYLREYSSQREEDTAALLQAWLDEDNKVAVNE
jgi:flagellar M-ring protein FliF